MGDVSLRHSLTGYLNPRAVLLKDNSLVGIGVGTRLQLSPLAAVVGDWTPLLSGQNTRRTSDGSRTRTQVWGVALRLAHPDSDATTLDLGYTTGIGATTGYSLTPGLGGKGALYLALGFHR